MTIRLAGERATDGRRPTRPYGRPHPRDWRGRGLWIGALWLSLCVGSQVASGQSLGSPCLAAPTLTMVGTRIVPVSSVAELQSAMGNLQAGDTYDNTIVFNGGAQSPRVYHVKLLNSGSQFIKANPLNATEGVDDGVVEYSIMEYTAGPPATDHGAGVGYTNGLSIHTADNWVIRRNVFKNFHTPDSAAYLWNPAVLMWNHSTNTLTEGNTFINVDRAIAYGLFDNTGSDHQGGVIRNNVIYLQPGLMSASRKASSDGQIIVWDSPGTKVYHNTILTHGNVVRSIEFRFNTAGGEVRNNLADAPIGTRDGATFSQSGNFLTATASLFVNPSAADLHLKSSATAVIDQAPALVGVTDDIDGNPRPSGAGYDIGADEYARSSIDSPLHLPVTWPLPPSPAAERCRES